MQKANTKKNSPLIYACKLVLYTTHNYLRYVSPILTHILFQLLCLLEQLLKGKRCKRPPAKFGKLGERLDPRQTQRVKLNLRLAPHSK
jgi:hypothetical protein